MEAYKERQLKWLNDQNRADSEENEMMICKLTKTQLQDAGLAILGLYPVEYKTCFGGRIAVDFSTDNQSTDSGRIKKSSIRTGDVVSVEAAGIEEGKVTGTVHKLSDTTITVIFETDPDLQGPVRLVKRGNPVVFERMASAIKTLDVNHPIAKLVFEESTINNGTLESDITNNICHLNEEQQTAVKRAVTAANLAIIHGPPGTGKTHCIAAIVKSLPNRRILLAAASNLAVDNMVERICGLQSKDLNVIRIGHPARLTDAVLKHSLDYQLADSDQGSIIRDIKRDIERQLQLLKTARKGKKDIYRELKELRFELRRREEKRLDELMTGRSVIIATTLNGAASRTVSKYAPYDVCIIDEASQALQAETWIAALQAPKLIIVGDHLQLPPTTDIAGLKETLFDVFIKKFADQSIMLRRQYRMHADIMEWSNERFYNKQLIADESVRDSCIDDDDIPPVLFIDTAGEAMWERQDTQSGSHWNEHEAILVVEHAMKIKDACDSIAIITPYSAQVECISNLLTCKPIKTVQVGTVDGFQGREADAVILSTVRSNSDRTIGFLSEARRLNVAVTRAKRHLCVVGDSETLSVEFGDLVKWLEKVALVTFPQAHI